MIDNADILEEARSALERIRPGSTEVGAWIREHVVDPVAEWASALLEWIRQTGGTTLGLVNLTVAALAAAALLGYLVVLLVRGTERRRRAAVEERVRRERRGAFDPADAEEEASRLAAEGRFAEAVRLLYEATLGRLHHRAGRRFDPSLTPGENLLPYRGRPFFDRLRSFVNGYLAVSFGARPLDAEGYRRLEAERPEEGRP